MSHLSVAGWCHEAAANVIPFGRIESSRDYGMLVKAYFGGDLGILPMTRSGLNSQAIGMMTF